MHKIGILCKDKNKDIEYLINYFKTITFKLMYSIEDVALDDLDLLIICGRKNLDVLLFIDELKNMNSSCKIISVLNPDIIQNSLLEDISYKVCDIILFKTSNYLDKLIEYIKILTDIDKINRNIQTTMAIKKPVYTEPMVRAHNF